MRFLLLVAAIALPATLTAPLPGRRHLITSYGGFLFTHRGYSGPAVLNISRGSLIAKLKSLERQESSARSR